MLIDGIHVPLTTPFYRDGKSYLRKLEHNVGRYSLTPAAGMLALAGEGEALSDEEMREALKSVSEFAAPEKVLIARIAKESVRAALWLADEAAKAGFDAILLRAPRGLTKAELHVFVGAVADSSELPVVLSSSAVDGLSVETIAEYAQHPHVIGLFDGALTVARAKALQRATAEVKREVTVTPVFAPVTRRMKGPQIASTAMFVTAESLTGAGAGGAAVAVAPPRAALKTRTKVVGFQLMAAGSAVGMVELLEAGVAGAMPALAACAPQGCYEAYAALKDGDAALAREKEHRLVGADALMLSAGIAAVKYGCDWNGYYGGAPRLPRLPLDAAGRLQVEKVLAGLRN